MAPVAESQDEPKVVDGGVPTLRVYTNLIQIPTLVLGPNREFVRKPIAENQFSISIEDGPLFRPTHVRQEGEDPITLSILLDVSGNGAVLMPKIGDALSELARSSLHPADRVSIYALDCGLIRSLAAAPADSASLSKAVDLALESWTLRRKQKSKCEQSIHLWDALAEVDMEMSRLPGRRVILAVTDGLDKGSKHTSNKLTIFAQATGTAVFGLRYVDSRFMAEPSVTRRSSGGPYTAGAEFSREPEDEWISVCELSGGIVTTTSETRSLHLTLEQFVKMLRQRYIVEFPRPSNSTAGHHEIQVKVAKSNYFIRPSGISVPLPDAALAADPTTIQSGPSVTPEQGTRKKPQ